MQPFVFLQHRTVYRLFISTFLFACCFSGKAQAYSPGEKKVTLSATQITLKEVFKAIRKQTGFAVFFSNYTTDIQLKEKVDVNFNSTPLNEVIRYLLRNKKDHSFKFSNEAVIIFKEDTHQKSFIPTNGVGDTTSTSFSIKGKITDAEGKPVPGATVMVKGTQQGTTADADGNFVLAEIKKNTSLLFSSIGYETRELQVKGGPILVRLNVLASDLDETVVIAYGTTTQRYSTGNVSVVKAKDIEKQPISNPLLALQGRVPGVTVSQANGIPGGGVTVRIQGRNNLDNTLVGSDPLVVVDGVPYPSQNLGTFLGGGNAVYPILGSSSNDGLGSSPRYGNPLAYINPLDIESISILKDADATAIYGSRAANGAILITTKKGKVEDMKVDINLQKGWGAVSRKMKLLTSQQYMEMRREAKRNDGLDVSTRDYDLRGLWDTTRYTDWQKKLIGGTANYTRVTAGVSGGKDRVQYLLSSTYNKETTVFPGDFANSMGSLHFNISAASKNRRLNIQLGGIYMFNDNKLPAEDFTDYALNLPPVAPALKTEDGSLNWAPDPLQNGNSTWYNPLSKQNYLFDTKTHNLVGNGSISYQIAQGLNVRSTFGFTSNSTDQFIGALDESEKPERRASRTRTATFSFNTSRSWIVEPQLSFQKGFNQHRFDFLAGTTFQYQNNNGRSIIASGQNSDLLLRDMLAGSSLLATTDINEYKYNAVFGRLNYSLQNKYLVNLTARRDGSSRFGPKSKFRNFWSAGLGWILSEESFLKCGLSFVSFAKIRGSYGITGNDQIGNYRFMSLYYVSNPGIPYQGQGVSQPLELPNANLEWEETHKLQAGIDLGLWKDRLLVTANYNRNRTSNSLTYVRMPLVTGFTNYLQNLPALIQNIGWEFTISSTNIRSEYFHWNTNFNLTIPRNKLLAFPSLETSTLKQFMSIGYPLSIIKLAPYYGIDQTTGNYMVRDKDDKPVSDPSDKDLTAITYLGPIWYGGFQNSISYRGISLDVLIQFTRQYGMDLLGLSSPGAFSTTSASRVVGNQLAEVMQRWQKPGDNTIYQRFSSNFSNGLNSGDLSYKNISFLRVKNVSLSYDLPTSSLLRLKIQQLRLYANAQNLLTITKYKGLDPETKSITSIPPLRMITVGVQATF